MLKTSHTRTRGISLVEVIVSVGLFAIVMIIGAGALANMSKAHRQARALRAAIENMSLALESMSREIRYATNIRCATSLVDIGAPHDCPNGEQYLHFTNFAGSSITYALSTEDHYVYRVDRNVPTGVFIPVSSSKEVAIDSVQFIVSGSQSFPTDARQPFVTITMKGHTIQGPVSVALNLQTSVVTRPK
jgi:type II secretory pathway pseudopilin PulG